eukprot:1007761-Rhodomonas_salina.1
MGCGASNTNNERNILASDTESGETWPDIDPLVSPGPGGLRGNMPGEIPAMHRHFGEEESDEEEHTPVNSQMPAITEEDEEGSSGSLLNKAGGDEGSLRSVITKHHGEIQPARADQDSGHSLPDPSSSPAPPTGDGGDLAPTNSREHRQEPRKSKRGSNMERFWHSVVALRT